MIFKKRDFLKIEIKTSVDKISDLCNKFSHIHLASRTFFNRICLQSLTELQVRISLVSKQFGIRLLKETLHILVA